MPYTVRVKELNGTYFSPVLEFEIDYDTNTIYGKIYNE